jgi:putative oxidoreductase
MFVPCAWSMPLQRTFTSFPSGWVAAALLVLRVVVGTTAMVEAALAVAGANSPLIVVTAALAALAGLALVLGFLTPIASALIAAEATTILLFMKVVVLQLLNSRMALFEFVVMAAALAILGPGAASIDARLFGRREVAINEEHRPHDL